MFYNTSVVILSLVFHSSFLHCYPVCSSYIVGRVFIEFFVFDYGSLPYLLSLFFFQTGDTFSLVVLNKIFHDGCS